MEDIIEFANENLEGDLDHDILNYGVDQNRATSSNGTRNWEITGISHLLNSSAEPSAEKMNSESEQTVDDFPSSSSSSTSHPVSSSDDSIATKGNIVRPSRRKRSRTDPLNKKPRIDYKNPFHADRLTKAITVVIAALRGDPGAFHKNITSTAKTHDIPYNTLRDNVLRARGIEPRAHRNSERKRQAEAVAAALERGVEYKILKSNLQIQTERVSVHIGDALDMDLEMEIKLCPVEEIVLPLPQQLILPQQQTLPVSVSISDSTELLLDDININLDNKDSEIIDPNQGNDSDSEDENENENEIEDGVETEIGFPVVF